MARDGELNDMIREDTKEYPKDDGAKEDPKDDGHDSDDSDDEDESSIVGVFEGLIDLFAEGAMVSQVSYVALVATAITSLSF